MRKQIGERWFTSPDHLRMIRDFAMNRSPVLNFGISVWTADEWREYEPSHSMKSIWGKMRGNQR
jgi:hypothetical protein